MNFNDCYLFSYSQASPRLRFNKEGSLLAVTTGDNGIKILANNDGIRLIRMLEGRALDKNRGPSEPTNSKAVSVLWFCLPSLVTWKYNVNVFMNLSMGSYGNSY